MNILKQLKIYKKKKFMKYCLQSGYRTRTRNLTPAHFEKSNVRCIFLQLKEERRMNERVQKNKVLRRWICL